jgi:uncharacterized membrane protein YoaK (UPF0700 family)
MNEAPAAGRSQPLFTKSFAIRSGDAFLALGLTLTAGYVDAVGYVKSGVFAANMTGNTVLAALSLAGADWTAAAERISTLGAFFLGAVLGRAFVKVRRGHGWWGLLVELAFLVAAGFVEVDTHVSLYLIAAAMGLQATAVTRFDGVAASTVVITSSMARVAEGTFDALVLRHRLEPAVATSVRVYVLTWIGYGGGALAAGLVIPHTERPLIPAIAAMTVLVLWLLWRSTRR